MPLQGKEKKDYQRSYMREYMRRKRASVKTILFSHKLGSVKTGAVKTNHDVKTKELTYERDDYAQE